MAIKLSLPTAPKAYVAAAYDDILRVLRIAFNQIHSANIDFIQIGSSAKSRSVQSKLREIVSVADYGAAGDGVVDDTVAVQAAIDANKGKTIIVPTGYSCLVHGILLSGSSYDGTKILVEGELKLKADGGASNFGGSWVGIIFKDCARCVFTGKWNGNRSAMTDNEHIHCIGLAGVSHMSIPYVSIREIRGDGIYISQSSWTSNTTNSTNVTIGEAIIYNSADDGRNAISIISCDDWVIQTLKSYKVGATVGSVLQPGGLDIEPNNTYQSVNRGVVGEALITSAGLQGIGIAGIAATNDATKDWVVQNISFGTININCTSNSTTPSLKRCRDITVHNFFTTGTGANLGFQVDFADRVWGRATIRNVLRGAEFGLVGTVNDFDWQLNVTAYTGTSAVGLRTVAVNRGRFSGRIYGATSSSSTFAIQTRSQSRGITQTGVVYAVDAPYDGSNARAFRNEPTDTVTYGTGTCVRDCDWTGYTSFSVQCDAQIPSSNVRGRNIDAGLTAAPASGGWARGDIAWFTQTAGSTAPGALCITAGAPGTWKNMANIAA